MCHQARGLVSDAAGRFRCTRSETSNRLSSSCRRLFIQNQFERLRTSRFCMSFSLPCAHHLLHTGRSAMSPIPSPGIEKESCSSKVYILYISFSSPPTQNSKTAGMAQEVEAPASRLDHVLPASPPHAPAVLHADSLARCDRCTLGLRWMRPQTSAQDVQASHALPTLLRTTSNAKQQDVI